MLDIQKTLKKSAYTSIVISILSGVLGLIMFIYSEATLNVITYLLSGVLIISGLVKSVSYFIQKGNYDFLNYDLVYGIVSILLGVVIITKTIPLENLLGLGIGIWIIYISLMRFGMALKLKAYERKAWMPMLVLAAVMMFFGIYVIFAPDIIIATVGIFLFISAIIDIAQNITFIFNINKLQSIEKKNAKIESEIEEEKEESEKE